MKELSFSKKQTKVSQPIYQYFFVPAVSNVSMHMSVILTKFYCDILKAIHAVELQAPHFKSKWY